MDNRKSVVEGYVFLNIQLPHCAWATYRGVLVSPPSISGFVSFWYASMLQNVDPQISRREMKLENVRRQRFTNRISRLKGLYCFLDKEDAKRTSCLWDGEHFTLDNLAEISLTEARSQDRLDSNWITFAPGFFPSAEWMPRYWNGEPFPNKEPIWETLAEGKAIVPGTELRKRAYDVVKSYWPDSLALLEIARLGASCGSDIGNISAFLSEDTTRYSLKYYMDMRDAKDDEFLGNTLPQLLASGHPVNHADIRPHFERGSFGRVPDMSQFQFSVPQLD